MMVKKTKNFQKVKNKLIKYYPPKVQLEMRPCLIFQPLFIKKRKKPHKKIPNNKKVLIQFMIIVFILLYGFYFYLKYLILKEEKQTRDFLYNLGFTTKRINNSFNLTYIKNSLMLAVLGVVLLEVFIEFVIRIHIYSLIIPVTKMLILLFFMAAFIIEFFIPTLIQMIMKKSKGTVMNR